MCAFDIEFGRLKNYTDPKLEPLSLTSPVDSYVQVIIVVVFHMESTLTIHFVYLPPEFCGVKLTDDKFNKYVYFSSEYDMICAFYLFINRFNQIVGQNSIKGW